MSKVLLATLVLATIQTEVPFSHHSVTLSKKADDGSFVDGEPIETTDPEITFDGLDAGTYKATGVSVDTAGDNMTAPVTSDEFVVTADSTTTSAQVVQSITLALAPVTSTGVTDPSTSATGTTGQTPAVPAPVVTDTNTGAVVQQPGTDATGAPVTTDPSGTTSSSTANPI